MRFLVALALLLSSWTAFGASDDLAGLWKAKKRFGPDTHGTLIIRRTADGYAADLAGQPAAVRADNGELTFAAANGDGHFRGKIEADGSILGFWARARTPVDSSEYATPVVLKADGENRWRGVVEPLQDEFTFYLLLQKRDDGSYGAVLRNVERDIGTQYGVDHLARTGNAVQLVGKRGAVASGTFAADDEVLELTFPNRGGSYDFVRDDAASDFYPRGKEPGLYTYRAPLALDDGWPVGTLDGADISRAAIEKLVQSIIDTPMDSTDAPQVHALLIARHGKLVVEEYFHGVTREKLHDTRSAGKSVTTIIAGAAMHAGAPLAPASKVYEVMNGGSFPDGLDAQKRTMTLENLLTMSSGYFCDDTNDAAPGNEETMTDQTAEPDYYRYTMRVPLVTPPGENSVYCSANANLALGMVGRVTGESPMYTFARLVARPMNIARYGWPLDPLGRPYGGGGLRLAARDFTKFGQLMLDKGSWHGQAILSPEFAAKASSAIYHLRNIEYGYLWWSENYPFKSRTVRAFSARGAGGQTVTVVPELDLVVTTMAGNYFSRKGQFAASTDPIPRSILPAVRETGDDPAAPVVERQYTTPYGKSSDGSRIRP